MKAIGYLLVCLMVFVSLNAEAQIVDRSKERAKDKTNNRIDQKVDNGIDKGLDAIEGLFKKKNKDDKKEKSEENTSEETMEQEEAAPQMQLGNLFGGKPLNLEPSYSYDHVVKMHMVTEDKKGERQEMDTEMYLNDEDPNFAMSTAMQGVSSIMVLDLEKQEMVMLTNANGQKMAMSMEFNPDDFENEGEESETLDGTFTKTGRTKQILGYTCYEYVYESEDGNGQFWVAEDEDLDVYSGFKSLASQNKKSADLPEDYPQGLVMEMTSTDADSKSTVTMVVTAVLKNQPQTISTEGYQSFNFPTE